MSNYELKQTILCLNGVSAGYGDKIILKGINLIEKDAVRPGVNATGQVIAVVGRSGRGKSTLFKVLTGLAKPIEGQVLISNCDTDTPDDAKEVGEGDVGFVDQKYTLFRHKTIYQACNYALRKSNLSDKEKKETITSYLVNWELIEHKDKYPCELSGGQKQRLAIMEQMLSSKHFIVFDEPTSGLDIGAINMVKNAFYKILETDELNTIIFSSHNIEFAVEMADSIYVIGFPEDTKEYSTIVKHFDLKEMGLAWKEFGIDHLQLIKEIKNLLLAT